MSAIHAAGSFRRITRPGLLQRIIRMAYETQEQTIINMSTATDTLAMSMLCWFADFMMTTLLRSCP
jgi:hypothetical protein